ncbi:uncharacterized protein CLAFUR5_01905 [Fulvia fulva]|uniref:Uncharacterized protein n=1 Tax=Passalora fulva TaxID=5499 RepID=A0A9Q8P482_PASFU|nr:uncharacterized protein CLAFUR5_01905 [Fulvia fulva]KAK4637684.1 hypothetical protein CLAFUR0_01908 [Fulvia fulva]UJO12703.1 hypothetical protein CLAFUR5_01905 [Fulvia fulva]
MSSHPKVDTSIPAYYQQPQQQQQQQQHRHPDQNLDQAPPRPPSPRAPAYSPITPKVQPVLPVPVASATQPPFVPPDHGAAFTFQAPVPDAHTQQPAREKPLIPPTEYIPQPPNLPFSSDDASDAIALRAAISTLQFQKKKAQGDLKTLQSLKQLALDDPAHFKTELAAGKLTEQRPTLGDLRAILDQESDGDDEDEDDDTPLTNGRLENGTNGRATAKRSLSPHLPAEIPDSQPSQPQSQTDTSDKMDVEAVTPFPRIPGPQNVVRMPYVNWDKYGIAGDSLESLHAQQQKWPGSAGTSQSKGREYTVAAPYSPFVDSIDSQQRAEGDGRKDSGATSTTPGGTTNSDRPMGTRSRNE